MRWYYIILILHIGYLRHINIIYLVNNHTGAKKRKLLQTKLTKLHYVTTHTYSFSQQILNNSCVLHKTLSGTTPGTEETAF